MVSNRYERNLAEFVKVTQWQTNTNAIMCMFSFSSKTKSTKIAPKNDFSSRVITKPQTAASGPLILLTSIMKRHHSEPNKTI